MGSGISNLGIYMRRRRDTFIPPYGARLMPDADPPIHDVIVLDASSSLDAVSAFEQEFSVGRVSVVALDCEGLNLGRMGKLSLIQLCAGAGRTCYLIDVLHATKDGALVSAVRTILQQEDICKIIHDCKTDSDALLHLLDIELCNVHDTSAWNNTLRHWVSHARTDSKDNTRVDSKENTHADSKDKWVCDENLNNTLRRYRLPENTHRDRTVYQTRPSFWLDRPMTEQMIQWASSDIRSLFGLRSAQLHVGRGLSAYCLQICCRHSAYNLRLIREYKNTVIVRIEDQQSISELVGNKGRRIHDIQKQSHTRMYGMAPASHRLYTVYFNSRSSLTILLQHIHAYVIKL